MLCPQLVYHLDEALRPIPNDKACAPLTGYFLGNQEEVAAKQRAVAEQSKARYGDE